MKVIRGVRDLVDEFDVFIVDIWGVLHDGSRPYDGVLDTIKRLKAGGGNRVVIALSNSSRRFDATAASLRNFGFDPERDFDRIVTSGEATHELLLNSSSSSTSITWDKIAENDNNGNRKVAVIGSGVEEDAVFLQECGGWTISSPDEAAFVLCRGPYVVHDGRTTTVADKRTDEAAFEQALDAMLQSCAERRLAMLVSNPDKKSPSVESYMPGAIGDLYEAALTKRGTDPETLVKRIGKPFPEVYQLALQGIDTDRSRVCMVGDALETDMTGGTRAGIGTVWVVKDGIHRNEVPDLNRAADAVASFNRNSEDTYAKGVQVHPDFVMEHFRW